MCRFEQSTISYSPIIAFTRQVLPQWLACRRRMRSSLPRWPHSPFQLGLGILQRGRYQTQELIPTREIFDVAIALIAIDANLKLVGREKIHKLREHGSAKIHRLPPEQAGKQYDGTEKEAIY